MDQDTIARAAGYLAEAFETGNPLAPLPPGLAPDGRETAEAMAGEVLDLLGLAPSGLRLALGMGGARVCGPVLDGRILRDGAAIAMPLLRHARVSAAAVGILRDPLDPDGRGAPVLAALHPALDVAGSRFRDGAADDAACIADLAGLGYVVAGRRHDPADGPVAVSCAPDPRRPRGRPVDLAAAFDEAAAAARQLGGLPAGALLVVAGLTPPLAPQENEAWVARLGGFGSARARFLPGVLPA